MASLSNGTSRYRELCVECSKEWFKTTAKALIIGMRETCVNILRRETKKRRTKQKKTKRNPRKGQARHILAHTCSESGITRGLCSGLGPSVTQDLRALRLWQSSQQWRAPAIELHECCASVTSLAEALPRQHIDGVARAKSVAQAPRADRARAPWSCSPC